MLESTHAAAVAARRNQLKGVVAEILARDRPFVFEVGCGNGHFLTAYAQTHPDEVCVGVDQSKDRIERSEKKRQRLGQGNVFFIRAEAADFLAALPSAARFSAIYMLFSDPWPKRRHHKNRLLQDSFLREVAKHSPPGVPFYFRTDHTDYFEAAAREFTAKSGWVPSDRPWGFEQVTLFQVRAPVYHSLVAVRV
jgi:tRNA (guanine-N7-)-methyltransferase